ncbi:MAG: RNA polymerase sigma factor [Solirubrobacteraceae bacterium]
MAVVISDQLLDRSDRLLEAEPDEHLVGLAQAGHEAAFAAIVRRYERELLAQARRLSSDGRAEDAVQQAFLNAFAALQAGSEVRHLRGWLHHILRNVVTRARVPADAPLEAATACSESLEETVQRRARAHATLVQLSALPDRQRDALLGTAVLGFPRAQVAQRMGLSEGAVRQLVHRARLRLREAATALVPLPFAKLFGAARSGGGAAGSEAALGAGTAVSGGVAIKVGALVASGVVATGLAVTRSFPAHHHHTAPLAQPRHHAAHALGARRLTEAPAISAGAPSAVPASLIVAHGGGVGARRGGGPRPGPGRDSGARGEQGSGHSGRGENGGARGSAGGGDGHGGSGSGSGSGGKAGSDSGQASSQGGVSGRDGSGSGRDGGRSGDGTSLRSTGSDGARAGTDPTSGSSSGPGSDGSGGSGGSDGSGGGSDASSASGGTTTMSTQDVAQQTSGGESGTGTTSGSGGSEKDSGGSRDLSGSLDSSSS